MNAGDLIEFRSRQWEIIRLGDGSRQGWALCHLIGDPGGRYGIASYWVPLQAASRA